MSERELKAEIVNGKSNEGGEGRRGKKEEGLFS
jgi:hypothetical protein